MKVGHGGGSEAEEEDVEEDEEEEEDEDKEEVLESPAKDPTMRRTTKKRKKNAAHAKQPAPKAASAGRQEDPKDEEDSYDKELTELRKRIFAEKDGSSEVSKAAFKRLCIALLRKANAMTPTVKVGQTRDGWTTRKGAFISGIRLLMAYKLVNEGGIFALPARDALVMHMSAEKQAQIDELLKEFGSSEKERRMATTRCLYTWLNFLKTKAKKAGTFGGPKGGDGEIWYKIPLILHLLFVNGFKR